MKYRTYRTLADDVLDFINNRPNEKLTNADIATLVFAPKPSIRRVTAQLEREGHIVRDFVGPNMVFTAKPRLDTADNLGNV